MRIVLLGGPGAGKSTQAAKLCELFQIQRVALGDLLREAIANQSPLGKQAEPFVKQGKLVPDDLMIEFMGDRLSRPDMSAGWVLEGYPRTAFQAEELDFLLTDIGQKLDWAIHLQASDAVLTERSSHRGLIDDTPEAIQARLQAFYESTIPILEYYQPRQKLLTIDAEQPSVEVSQAIVNALTKLPS